MAARNYEIFGASVPLANVLHDEMMKIIESNLS